MTGETVTDRIAKAILDFMTTHPGETPREILMEPKDITAVFKESAPTWSVCSERPGLLSEPIPGTEAATLFYQYGALKTPIITVRTLPVVR